MFPLKFVVWFLLNVSLFEIGNLKKVATGLYLINVEMCFNVFDFATTGHCLEFLFFHNNAWTWKS